MDIKELGTVGFLVIGGAAYGISQYGLNDVLTEELRHISEVSMQERPAYMDGVVEEFTNAFDSYYVETETYQYVGISEFSTFPSSGTFVEVVTQNSPVPSQELKGIQTQMNISNFCEQAEMTMFTDKGWMYRFSMKDSKGSIVYSVTCAPVESKLRGVS